MEENMRMIVPTKKRRRKQCEKQINLKSINVHKRVEHPELYKLLRDEKLLLLNLN